MIIRNCLHNILVADTALLAGIISHCFESKCFICMGQEEKRWWNECLLIHPHSGFHFPSVVFRTAVKLTPGIGFKISRHVCAKAIKPKEKAAINHATNHGEYNRPPAAPQFTSIPRFQHRVDLKCWNLIKTINFIKIMADCYPGDLLYVCFELSSDKQSDRDKAEIIHVVMATWKINPASRE